MPDIHLADSVLVAIVTGAFSVFVLLVKHWFDAAERRCIDRDVRLKASEARLDAYDEFITEIVTWAFELEEHITLGKPPPPPDRPKSLIRFFAMRLGGRAGAPTPRAE